MTSKNTTSTKKAILITVVVVLVTLLSFGWLRFGSPLLVFMPKYAMTLSAQTPPYSQMDYAESDSGYLYTESEALAAESFDQVIRDYFSSPARLYFTVADSGAYDGAVEYKCDRIKANQKFIEVFEQISVQGCDAETATTLQNSGASHVNTFFVAGRSYVCELDLYEVDSGKTLIVLARGTDGSRPRYDAFLTDTPLLERYEKAVKKVKPFAMRVEDPTEVPH